MTRRPSTDDQLRALADQRATAQALLGRTLAELEKPDLTPRRVGDALTLLARLLIEIDGFSAAIEQLRDRRQQEWDAEKPGRMA